MHKYPRISNDDSLQLILRPVNMSFLGIKDPEERERIVHEYMRLRQNIRERDESKRWSNIHQQRTLEKTFAPIIQSQKHMTDEIVKTLKNEREEIVPLQRKKRKLEMEDYGPLEEDYRQRYALRDPDIDTKFGINFLADGKVVIGDTPITIQDDDIVIRDNVYDGSEGLWQLLTERKKANLNSYDGEDLTNYMNILRDTHVLHNNLDPDSPYPRSSASWKWTNILGRLWKKMRSDDGESDEEHL